MVEAHCYVVTTSCKVVQVAILKANIKVSCKNIHKCRDGAASH